MTTEDAARAEEVRAWLVQLRGGAPFLSAADGKLLVDWLDAKIPVPTILHGIELVAERRRAKRTRTPFSLQSCRATIEKLARAGGGWRTPADLVVALAPAEPDALVVEALVELAAITGDDPEARARYACAVLRRFHARVWDALGEERAALLAEAAEDLGTLEALLGHDGFERACEEHARDRVRARYPTLSATRVWEEFGLGMV
ncbi:MAG: hypothetical protein Q8P18_16810 [Pseudomonadota bacterium]|nr:hypothetical protein [Pseudomonadota bacterium]